MRIENSIDQFNDEIFGEYIHFYTRQQAIEDGTLTDVSTTAKEAGFKIPVAVTSAVWHDCIEWTEEDNEKKETYQDLEGRLWDVLYMLHVAIKSSASQANTILYQLYVVPRDGKSKHAKEITLKSMISGGDRSEPVITIMLANED
jgi:type I site-specific restriction-modification system R (restriction) subunit